MSYLTRAESAALLDEVRRLNGLPPPADPRWAPVRANERRPDVEYQEVRTFGDPEPLFYPIALPDRHTPEQVHRTLAARFASGIGDPNCRPAEGVDLDLRGELPFEA